MAQLFDLTQIKWNEQNNQTNENLNSANIHKKDALGNVKQSIVSLCNHLSDNITFCNLPLPSSLLSEEKVEEKVLNEERKFFFECLSTLAKTTEKREKALLESKEKIHLQECELEDLKKKNKTLQKEILERNRKLGVCYNNEKALKEQLNQINNQFNTEKKEMANSLKNLTQRDSLFQSKLQKQEKEICSLKKKLEEKIALSLSSLPPSLSKKPSLSTRDSSLSTRDSSLSSLHVTFFIYSFLFYFSPF